MEVNTLKEVKSVLISQPAPENGKSPFWDLATECGVKVDFRQFIYVDGVVAKDFRKSRIYIDQYSSVIFTSKNAIEHYFRLCEEMRVKVSEDTKYFCISEAIALYLQKYIQYRKRKVFFGDGKITKLVETLVKHKDKTEGKFLLPCSDVRDQGIIDLLTNANIDFSEAIMFRTLASDLSDLSDVKYDILVFFSPTGIGSLFKNFPDFVQEETRIAVFGNTTAEAAREKDLRIDIQAPSPIYPSMASAVKAYIEEANKMK
ncbi:MAG: uroporphyrinogen-III synthase [Chitinophagales bacterium]|nr:uroporphyrinogen-III synthase [Chitinophagales bacterium]